LLEPGEKKVEELTETKRNVSDQATTTDGQSVLMQQVQIL
jgi:hypothetical protein